MYRTDPLKDNGTFDTDFFTSNEYESEQKCLINYLELEGFESIREDFVIDFRSRRWHIRPDQSKRRKNK